LELVALVQNMKKQVTDKERRSSEGAQRKRGAARARRQGHTAPSSYMHGGTAAALAFDALNITRER
jgi:hypothetical protein